MALAFCWASLKRGNVPVIIIVCPLAIHGAFSTTKLLNEGMIFRNLHVLIFLTLPDAKQECAFRFGVQ